MKAIDDIQEKYPFIIPLFTFTPERKRFDYNSFNPADVKSAGSLPEEILLCRIVESSFKKTGSGWSTRWIGLDDGSHIDISYSIEKNNYRIFQTWRDLDAGISFFPANTTLDKIILTSFCTYNPTIADQVAKGFFEKELGINYVIPDIRMPVFSGMPDGIFKIISIPVPAGNIRLVKTWLQDSAKAGNFKYPLVSEAGLFYQTVYYAAGKGEGRPSETVFPPFEEPIEINEDEDMRYQAYSRYIYAINVLLPFGGILDFLKKALSANSPLKYTSEDKYVLETAPFIISCGHKFFLRKLIFWNEDSTAGSLWTPAGYGIFNRIPFSEDVSNTDEENEKLLFRAEKTCL